MPAALRERLISLNRSEWVLARLLSDEQAIEWRDARCVTEQAPSGRLWRFKSGGGYLVSVSILEDDGVRPRVYLCVHTRNMIPPAELIAGFLLTVRSGNENHLITTGNNYGGYWSEEERLIRQEAGVYDWD